MQNYYINEGKDLLKSWFSKKSCSKKEGYLYIDLHAHFLPLKFYKNGLDTLVEELMKKVDAIAIVDRGDKPYNLFYDDLKEALKNSAYCYRDLGKVVEIKKDNNLLYIIKGAEVRTLQNLHFLAVGSNGKFYDGQDITEAIEEAKEGIKILPHPFSVNAPLILGRLANKSEKDVIEAKKEGFDAIEAFNPMNNLWLFRSNALAKKFAKENSIPSIAASDTHSGLEQVGMSGIMVKKDSIKAGSDYEFISSLKEALRSNNFSTVTSYDNPFNFAKGMLWPHIKSIRSLKEVADLVLFLLMNKPKNKKDSVNARH